MRPTTKVRELLAEQKQAGGEFSKAWAEAIRSLEADERSEWRDTLQETVSAWRAAYENKPASRAQLALLAVDQDPERDVPTGQADPWARVCPGCGGPVPAVSPLDLAARRGGDLMEQRALLVAHVEGGSVHT